MPTYNYRCKVCGKKFEKFVRFSEDPNQVKCPNGHLLVQREFTPPAIVFKGKGFYITDNRSPEK